MLFFTNRINKSYIICFLFLLCRTHALFCADSLAMQDYSPALLLSKAWACFDEHRLGDAHRYAYAAWEKNAQYYAEASYLLGLTHYADADYDIAQYYFNRALTEEVIPALRIRYLYSLADVYAAQNQFDLYEKTLRTILRIQTPKKKAETLHKQRQQARKVLFKQGLDRVLDMYRFEGDEELVAAEKLAMLLYQRSFLSQQGRLPYDKKILPIEQNASEFPQNSFHASESGVCPDVAESIEWLLYALDSQISLILQRLRYYCPEYQWTSLKQLFIDGRSYAEIKQYCQQDVYRTVYLLAVVMYRYKPEDTQYKVLLNMIRLMPDAGLWAQKADGQFTQPYWETYGLENSEFLIARQDRVELPEEEQKEAASLPIFSKIEE